MVLKSDFKNLSGQTKNGDLKIALLNNKFESLNNKFESHKNRFHA